MISIKTPALKSWFDPLSVPALSFNLSQRLDKRMNGCKGLFITLTYRRDEYEDPSDLYYESKEQQHVPLFIRRLQKYLGVSLKGKWMRKMEFQEGGWIHYHLIIEYPGIIPADDLAELWGFGFVRVNRLNEERRNYMTKYVAKEGCVPAWILAEKPKTVKIIAVSPGFWQEDTPKKKAAPKKPADPWGKSGCYVPIAVRLEEIRNTTLCREGVEMPKYFTLKTHIGFLVNVCHKFGVAILGGKNGWLHLDTDRDTIKHLAELAAADAAALNLISKRDPENCMPDWIKGILLEKLDEERYMQAG